MKGKLFRGSISSGLDIKLTGDSIIEDIKVGNFVVVAGKKNKYLCMVTDIKYEAVNPQIMISGTDFDSEIDEKIIEGTGVYGVITLSPMIQVDENQNPLTVKSIPSYGSYALDADKDDIYAVFGEPSDENFYIGTPPEMDIPICINLKKLVERSTGIFGRAGTGKTYLTRLLLSGLVKSKLAVSLIFDAHNEYGYGAKSENSGYVKGLKQLFGSKVAIFTLDRESSLRRQVPIDGVLNIAYNQITPDDILLLNSMLNLNSTAIESIYQIMKKEGNNWLYNFLNIDASEIDEYALEIGANGSSLQALRRKLERFTKLPFLMNVTPNDCIKQIMDYLQNGINVVIEFGSVSTLGYMLVANIITRHIHDMYVKKSEEAIANNSKGPLPLVITVEEAHRFLDPSISKETTMGEIAREMRKYNVTLLIVDQRTSQIDTEVMSQIGTKITCRLEDDNDISSFLSGVNNASKLRNVLASLDQKQQALIIGHAVPMPVVIKTRNYDQEFYKDVSTFNDSDFIDKPFLELIEKEKIDELFPD
ncbi:ATP-binding protein [Thermoanaerobacterium thermosaccharolyticum]|uniref:Putative ATPase n=1 Tax=Thermoanaerobacterium thermosaccharolyticum M0795 TaxID=698948 RepID=L0IJR3_THETR|nr:ATP-binding protein [Thermoanaerobacterium thermosaccharolyticum]AGB18994.1 putative ATPase [Thermoanaerobacterium thermosaccharolyticum M0795]